MADLLSTQLQECSWRGLSFPIELVEEKGGQRLAIHHKMDRDGAQVEGTGRLPYAFSVRAFFLDSLTQGVNESWADLFPQTWLSVKSLLDSRATGIFVHPLYGNINCKPATWHAKFDANVRNGVIVDMEFIETIDDSSTTTNLQPSVIGGATSAALNLDSAMLGFDLPIEPDMLGFNSFSDAMSSIISLGPLAGLSQISKLINGLYNFIDGIISIGDSIASLFDSIYAFIDSLNVLALEFQFLDKETAIYTVGFDTTLASIAGFVGNTIDNIIQLNPTLVAYAIVPKDTQVVYYTQ